jgi:hypothetical protein
MLSQVQIVNMALAKIGDFYISSMTEGTKQANYAGIFWESARDTLLESYPWSFAMERVRLARLADVPAWGYDYKYQLPNDYLKLRDISVTGDFDRSQTIDYKIEGRTIVTNETVVYIKYTKKVTDTSYYPPTFSRALAADLSLLLSEPLSAMSADKIQLVMQEREYAIGEAQGKDFDEGRNEQVGYYEMTSCRDN